MFKARNVCYADRTQAGGAFSPKDNLVATANAVIDAGIQISMSYRTPDNGCNDVSGQMLCLIVTKCIGVGAGITIGGYRLLTVQS